MKIALSGSSGFLGSKLYQYLLDIECEIIRIGRDEYDGLGEYIYVNSIGPNSRYNLKKYLCDVVIHCAGRAHIMKDCSSSPLDEFREINTYGTLNLAKQASEAGVKRFIYISTAKVNGEYTLPSCSFKPDDANIPTDPYAISKYEAEIGLWAVAKSSSMEVVVIRPPLIYGPMVKGNFLKMMKWLVKGIPLPLGAIRNKRSLVSLDNLVDLIVTCIDHPHAANETFLVSDDEDISTTELLIKLAALLESPTRLLPVPTEWLMLAVKLIGKQEVSQRLLASLQLDITKTKKLLGWTPPYSVDEGLEKTTLSFLKE